MSDKISKAQQKAVQKYVSKNYDRVVLTLPKGNRDVIKDIADQNDMSMNAYITQAIEEKIHTKVSGWIPCNERMPKDAEEVIICFDFKGRRSVDIGHINGDGEAYCYSDEYLTLDARKYRKTVAWMQLPKPYKE